MRQEVLTRHYSFDMLALVLGNLFGTLFSNLALKNYVFNHVEQLSIREQLLNGENCSSLELWIYVFGRRSILLLLLLVILAFFSTECCKILLCFLLGACLGLTFCVELLADGISGVLFYILALFPQWLFYILSLVSFLYFRDQGKRFLSLLGMGSLFFVGVFCESYIQNAVFQLVKRFL